MRILAAVILFFSFVGFTFAQPVSPGKYYVKEASLEEHLAPKNVGKVTNRIYRQQVVDVFEVKNGWARVSKYYDGQIEGVPGQVARWVRVSGLSPNRPQDLKQPEHLSDPRIAKDAIPKVGEGGLTKKDVQILYKGALKFLGSGQCAHVESGDKSVNRANTYYINCGGANIFFTPSDLK